MANLKYWQDKIKEKRSKTDFRDFLMWVASWLPLSYYKNNWVISRYPKSWRIGSIVSKKDYTSFETLDFNWDDFFDNFSALYRKSEFSWILHYTENQNCDYSDVVLSCKDSYLSNTIILDCSEVFYSYSIKENSNRVYNSINVWNNSDIIYYSSWIIESSSIFYSRYILNSNNIWFSSNMIWCWNCLFCNDLENKSYCINNKQYSKTEYYLEKEKILKNKDRFNNYYLSVDEKWKCIWDNLINSNFAMYSSDVENSDWVYRVENVRNAMFWWWKWENKNIYDSLSWGTTKNEDVYWVCNAWAWSNNLYLSFLIASSSNIYYCMDMDSCSYCIWCIWLKNKSYCIFNKQYTKEQWEIMADNIFSQMDSNWILWDFFPWELNPFYFNDTMAWILWDFTKEEVEKKWYMWRDDEIKVDIPEGSDIVKTSELNDFQGYTENWEWRINPEILKKVIVDEKWNYYRIVKMEYDFLVKHWLPLPEIHWMDRMKLNFWV